MNPLRHTYMWLGFLASAIVYGFGALFLYAGSFSGVQVAAVVVGGVAWGVATIGLLWSGLGRGQKMRSRVIGRIAEVREPISNYQEGYVFVNGELWKARLASAQPTALDVGAWAKVVGQSGITLLVVPPNDGDHTGHYPPL